MFRWFSLNHPARKARSSRVVRAGRAASRRAFTLLELMVVVIIVGLLAFMAVPTMSSAGLDRRVHENASNIQDLIREARARAMGRGGSVMVALEANTKHFRSYEVRSDVDGGQNLPLTSCRAPTDWTISTTTLRVVGSADMDSTYEANNNIGVKLFGEDGIQQNKLYLCFTPQGRTFISTTTSFDPLPAGNPGFSGPLTGALRVEVKRTNADGSITYGIVRNVLIPPTGAARVVAGT